VPSLPLACRARNPGIADHPRNPNGFLWVTEMVTQTVTRTFFYAGNPVMKASEVNEGGKQSNSAARGSPHGG